MQSGTRWVSTTLLPLSAMSLGRLVGDISNPECDQEDTYRSEERPDGPELLINEIKGQVLQQDVSNNKSWNLSLALTAALGSTLAMDKSSFQHIEAELITTRTLTNSTRYFEEACRVGTVRSLLERRWRDRRKVFMATGVITLTNAHVTIQRGENISAGPAIKLPGSAIVLAATQGAVPTLGGLEDVLDSELAVTRGTHNLTSSTISFRGENIFAVQYRQVGFSWFRDPSQKKPALKEGAQWKAYMGSRGEESDLDSSSNDGNTQSPCKGQDDERRDDSNSEGQSDDEDVDYVTLRAQVGGNIDSEDLSDFTHFEDFTLGNGDELWHIS